MKLAPAILATALLFVAPAVSAQWNGSHLVGAWDADFDAMLAANTGSEEELALATAMLGDASLRITFGSEGSFGLTGQVMGESQSESGTWAVASATGNTLTLTTTTTSSGFAETEQIRVTFRDLNTMSMADESGEAIPFRRAGAAAANVGSAAARRATLPASIGTLMTQDSSWSDGECSAGDLDRASVNAVDLNRDGSDDYIVWHPCNHGANDGQVDVYLRESNGYRGVLRYFGEALEPEATVTNGFYEIRGEACDGWADCETVYYRWGGREYERYRQIRDQQTD